MQKGRRIYGGFDLTFIDINIQPFTTDGNLIRDLPKLGTHHTTTNINFIPGGNGFNFCRTLANLGKNVTYVGASSDFFNKLVINNEIPLKIEPIPNAKVNFTSILNLYDGEIQFNSTCNNLSPEFLNKKIISYYCNSELKHISNIALNDMSIEWIGSLLLSLSKPEHPFVNDSTVGLNSKISLFKDSSFEGIMFIDPSDISHFPRMKELIILLKAISGLEGEKYLSLNENEFLTIKNFLDKSPQELVDFLQFPIILHTSDVVTYFGKHNYELEIRKITNPKTFVGAGDCFNGSFFYHILDNNSIEDSLKFAIAGASYLIQTGTYPTISDLCI